MSTSPANAAVELADASSTASPVDASAGSASASAAHDAAASADIKAVVVSEGSAAAPAVLVSAEDAAAAEAAAAAAEAAKQVPFSQLYRYASTSDVALLVCGGVLAAANGVVRLSPDALALLVPRTFFAPELYF